MKQRELARLHVLNNVLEYQVPIGQAAEILGVTERHARQLLGAYRRDGAAALSHGYRGRQPHNAVLDSEAAAVVRLASAEYAGTNHTHLTELLREREGINLSRPTVRRILVKAGIGSPRRRRSQQRRVRRQRMPQEGMLVQIDGSHHRRLGEGGPTFALLLTVDDATGTVPAAMFCREEDRDLRPRKSKAQQHRIPSPRQRTLRENVQQAKVRGLSLRATARELGIHRNTVRKYALAESPPLRKIRSAARTLQPETGTPA